MIIGIGRGIIRIRVGITEIGEVLIVIAVIPHRIREEAAGFRMNLHGMRQT